MDLHFQGEKFELTRSWEISVLNRDGETGLIIKHQQPLIPMSSLLNPLTKKLVSVVCKKTTIRTPIQYQGHNLECFDMKTIRSAE